MKKPGVMVLICLLIILGIAVFFRVWYLTSVPPGLYPDEAINGNQAISEPGKIFYPENNGREGLFINLLALSFSIFGISIWAFKIVPAIFGILTVLGTYLLTKELFKDERIALFSSFFLAVSFWFVNFSRIGFRAILVPFVLVFLFYFLFRGLRTKSFWDFAVAGIFFGLGFHTYIAFRMAVLIIIPILALKRKLLPQIVCFLILALLVALPIGIYFVQNPGDFVSRTTGVSIFAQPNPILAFGESLVRHLTMFNFAGDNNWRHNFAGLPQLCLITGIFFLIGFFASVKNARKSLSYLLLILWFFVMLLPGVLTIEGVPHALRVIGVIPVVYIFAGLGGWHSYNWLSQKVKNKKILISVFCLILIAVGFVQFNKYFVKWANLPEVKGAFSQDYVKIGNYLNSLSPETQKYVIVNQSGVLVDSLPVPAQTPMFIERTEYGQPRAVYLLPENLNEIEIKEKTVIVPMRYDEALFQELKLKFPDGEIQEINGIKSYVK